MHADSRGVYTNEKFVHLSAIDKTCLKCDVFDGSALNGSRESVFFNAVLDKPAAYKVFCESETIHYKKINKSFLNIKTFFSEDNNHEEVNFNGETLTFTLDLIKNWFIKGTFKILKVIHFVLVVDIDLLQKHLW